MVGVIRWAQLELDMFATCVARSSHAFDNAQCDLEQYIPVREMRDAIPPDLNNYASQIEHIHTRAQSRGLLTVSKQVLVAIPEGGAIMVDTLLKTLYVWTHKSDRFAHKGPSRATRDKTT